MGQLNSPAGICVSPDGSKVYVSDAYSRIQVFKKARWTGGKAIIVAGTTGPEDHLWNATQMSANFAYRTLTYQGFTKETIFYLSPNIELDLDSNGKADDVDSLTTNKDLEYAITTWAKDADALTLYIVDHGGNETFQMSDGETLSASELAAWLNQADISGKVTVVYDACYSETFMQPFTQSSDEARKETRDDGTIPSEPDQEWIVMTSASPET